VAVRENIVGSQPVSEAAAAVAAAVTNAEIEAAEEESVEAVADTAVEEQVQSATVVNGVEVAEDNTAETPISGSTPPTSANEVQPQPTKSKRPTKQEPVSRRRAPSTVVKIKRQPRPKSITTNPSSPQTVLPPNQPTIYTRQVSHPIANLSVTAIAAWFKHRTQAERIPISEADRKLKKEARIRAEEAEVDRQRMKPVQERRDRERAALEQVKKAAEQNAAEAAAIV
jgi:hypothetical protein